MRAVMRLKLLCLDFGGWGSVGVGEAEVPQQEEDDCGRLREVRQRGGGAWMPASWKCGMLILGWALGSGRCFWNLQRI